MWWVEYKISTGIAFVFVLVFILPTSIIVYKNWDHTMNVITKSISTEAYENYSQIHKNNKNVSEEKEKKQIQNWIKKNNLNQFGDSKNTVYIGGTPLYNELTGKKIDLYDYILQKHPSRPWKI